METKRLDEIVAGAPSLYCALIMWLVIAFAAQADTIGALKQATTPSAEEFNAGVQAYNMGDLSEARKRFEESSRLDAHSPYPVMGLAKVAIRHGDTKTAGVLLKKATALGQHNPEVLTAWGHYLLWQKRYEEARAAFDRAIAADPNFVQAHIELGDTLLLSKRQPSEAADAYRSAIAIDPKNARVHYSLANALAKSGDLDGAEAELRQAVQLEPSNAELRRAYADFLFRRRKRQAALEAYSETLKLTPRSTEARLARGDLLFEQGEDAKALAEYEEALKIDPNSGVAHAKVGVVEERQGNFEEAEKSYGTALRLDSNSALASNNLAWLAVSRGGDLDAALNNASKAVALAPNVGQFYDTLGWVYRARGRRDKAIEALTHAVSLQPSDPLCNYHLGIAYAENGQRKAAEAALAKAVAANGNFSGADDARKRLKELQSRAAH